MGDNAIGVLLTGMGLDGAHACLECAMGAVIPFAQDEASSVGSGVAVKLGGVVDVMLLNKVADAIVVSSYTQEKKAKI